MAISFEKLDNILKQAFPNAKIELIDLVGDNDHYSVTITDIIFNNKSRIEQHKLVNQSLKEILGDELHALQIKTKIPC